MIQFVRYFQSYGDVRGRLGGLPSWARGVVALVALPGLVLVGLSIVLFLVSLFALLLLTVPVYRVLRFICVSPAPTEQIGPQGENVYVTSGARRIDVKIVE